jgi:molybdopterin-guanine dinucleotide biosynthesis protein A
MQTAFDAVILAGQDARQPNPLLRQAGVTNKALLPVAGRPMIEYVLNALAGSAQIGQIVVVGLAAQPQLVLPRAVIYLPDQGSLMDNVMHGFGWLAQQGSAQHHGLLLTADVPLLTTAMVDWFINACQPLDLDLYWGVVERSTMEATFTGSKRTYLRLVEGSFCSGDLMLGKIELALQRQELVRRIVDRRKSILQQLRMLGPGVVIKFLLRRLTRSDLRALLQKLLHLRGQEIILPFAEVGMDVDKPHQLAQVEAYLAQRGAVGQS